MFTLAHLLPRKDKRRISTRPFPSTSAAPPGTHWQNQKLVVSQGAANRHDVKSKGTREPRDIWFMASHTFIMRRSVPISSARLTRMSTMLLKYSDLSLGCTHSVLKLDETREKEYSRTETWS